MPNPFAAAALEGVTFCFAQVLGIGRVRNNIDLADQRSKTGEKNVRNNIILADPQISPDIRANQHPQRRSDPDQGKK